MSDVFIGDPLPPNSTWTMPRQPGAVQWSTALDKQSLTQLFADGSVMVDGHRFTFTNNQWVLVAS